MRTERLSFPGRKPIRIVMQVVLVLLAILISVSASAAPRRQPLPRYRPRPAQPAVASQRHAVRFDAGYYYNGLSAAQLSEQLAAYWASQGVNSVYFYAYCFIYGARYYTTYPDTVMEDLGREDLLGQMLNACHKRNIRVYAWLFGPVNMQAWLNHPDWRSKNRSGGDYRPQWLPYRLCLVHPEFRAWWRGFIQDLLERYPSLDGIDLAEPQVAEWGDRADFNPYSNALFEQLYPGVPYPGPIWRLFRADTMTDFLRETAELCHAAGREFHLTQTLDAEPDGTLMSNDILRDAIGFDLDVVLNGAASQKPDVFIPELIWQQWLAEYGDPRIFSPAWTTWATQQAKAWVAGRAPVIPHIEVSDFGAGALDGPRVGQTALAAIAAGPAGVDIYDTNLLDETAQAWSYLAGAWSGF